MPRSSPAPWPAAVIEAGGVANGTSGTPTATGDLNSTDVDNPNDTWTAVGSPTASANGYGTYTLTAAGVWVYTLNNSKRRGAGAQCRRHADRHASRPPRSAAPPSW